MQSDQPASSPEPRSSKVRKRSRKTRPAVFAADRAAGVVIMLGGVGTILAVSLVCVFLIWVVVPLFLPGSFELDREVAPQSAAERPSAAPARLAIDEYQYIGWVARAGGDVVSYRTDTGEELARHTVFEADQPPTASAYTLIDGHVVYGFADGTMRRGQIDFAVSFLQPSELPDDLKKLPEGEIATFREGVLLRTPQGQYRLQKLNVDLKDPVKIGGEAEIALIDVSLSTRGTIIAALTLDSKLHVAQVRERYNQLTGETVTNLQEGVVDVEFPDGQFPTQLKLAGLGDAVYLAWEDGALQRYDTRNSTRPVFAESLDLVEELGERVTSLDFLVGKTSLVVGDSTGRVRVWFRTKPDDAATPDGAVLTMGHEFTSNHGSVTHLAPSPRSRMLVAAYEGGDVRLFHVTSQQTLAEIDAGAEIEALTFAPKEDAIFALADAGRGEQMLLWAIDAPHPEVTWGAIFRPVWYESANQPENVWQSSSGSDDFEEKYGLVPLVFGTVKATFYSMLFGVPLALLAAIYSSEFLHPRAKARIKPTIEIMASLPSVVLGFLAALVFAPVVEKIVPQCLALLITVPFAFLLGAFLWQLIPGVWSVKARRYRILGMALCLPVGLALAWPVGDVMERWLFAGDIMGWLDGQIGGGVGAWMFLCLPASALVVVWGVVAVVDPVMRKRAGSWSRFRFGLLDLAKFLIGCLVVLVLAYFVSSLLSMAWDPRGSFVDTYVQRNALVVGFIMGFAIIPIIYTISDDALSAVPESLRAGSLGAGATPWQTAIRIVVPTAMSGLFSAMMIGLGRAVGETMIVLMAAGNTPLMDWNIFNGFRTLSANIAVELPEAVINSTHYRMLFLAALSLFVMTFLVNTVAEVVRIRFRKKAFQL
jgi:phosphate transport system permease protein